MSKKQTARDTSVEQRHHKRTKLEAFDLIDGRHPWQKAVPNGFVPYQVRQLGRGKVAYFNRDLAFEMGLISSRSEPLTDDLINKVIDTFSIQIINEYDQANGVKVHPAMIKSHAHMATRYLQLQHADKRGRTSGDGRSIWNGTFRSRGRTWDISSRGTGVTCLAPGAVEANAPLKTGETTFGYGCGQADLTELLGSAIMSEIFHSNGIGTERVLAVIDLGQGCGIGVRAAPNLLRPAHLFLYLKQERYDDLRAAADYLISRQFENGEWTIAPDSHDRDLKMLTVVADTFAKFAARLERQYIFAWLDWDGDNVLANGGIIDYGSIRQFGLRHDQYRYDDVQRFSTTLNEQRGKARDTVQVFAQLVDYLKTQHKRPLSDFAQAEAVRLFDRIFDRELRQIFLEQVGCSLEQIQTLMASRAHRRLIERLYTTFVALEKVKTKGSSVKVPDGINRVAILNMRTALRALPDLHSRQGAKLSADDFFQMILARKAKRYDRKMNRRVKTLIQNFLADYAELLMRLSAQPQSSTLRDLSARAFDANLPHRITGNASEFIVEELIQARKRGLSLHEIQTAIELFIASQTPRSKLNQRRFKLTQTDSAPGHLMQKLVQIAQAYEEDI
jgi:uncharacterized protein YdiU (UPF0061 family)